MIINIIKPSKGGGNKKPSTWEVINLSQNIQL